MRVNRSTAIFCCCFHRPEDYIAADVRKKKFTKNIFFSDEIREAPSCAMITVCALNPFTEQNAEFPYRE
jgi:hypothetical protein